MRESSSENSSKGSRILSIFLLLVYLILGFFLWHLAKYGSLSRHLKIIIPIFILFILLLALKFFKGRSLKKESSKDLSKEEKEELSHQKAKDHKLLKAAFLAISLIYAGMIIYTGIPYHGALSWKIGDWRRHKKIEFVHNNLYQNGLQGLLGDISEKFPLPENLYIVDSLVLDFDSQGQISKLETFLYGVDRKGKTQTFLISYDKEKSQDIDLWLGGEANADFSEDKLLSPFFKILDQSDYASFVRMMSASQEDQEKSPELWEFLYDGRRSFADPTRKVILSPSGPEDPAVRASLDGGEIVGYEASLYKPKKKEQTLIRYILEPSYQSAEELQEEHRKDIRDSAFSHSSAKDGPAWNLDPQDGSLYYFLPQNHQLAYRLSVQDAAGGSRFYVLEKSYDAGESWEEINNDPFQGQAGQVEGMEFFTEDFGFIGIQGPSADWSHLFVSWDGGKTFEKVRAPFDQVSEEETNAEPAESEPPLSKLEEEYSYYRMPEKEGDQLLLTLTQEGQADAGNTQLTFISKDQGRSWTYKKTN